MNPQQELDLLNTVMDELLDAIDEILQSGESILDELRGELAEEIEITTARMVELQQQIQAQQSPADGMPPPIPQLDQGPFASSNVNAFKYDPKSQQLFVKFHGAQSAESGPIYKYNGVPRNIYDAFASGSVAPRTSGSNRYHTWVKGVTPSLGASLNELVKEGGYAYQRMTP